MRTANPFLLGGIEIYHDEFFELNDLYMSPFIFIVGLALTLIGIGAIIAWRKLRQIVDKPNKRSSHSQPTIKGAGLVLAASIVIIYLFIDLILGKFDSLKNIPIIVYVLVALTSLALISWLDDLYGLSVGLRLFMQLLIIASLLVVDDESVNFFPTSIPWWIWFFSLLSCWCWFTNIFN